MEPWHTLALALLFTAAATAAGAGTLRLLRLRVADFDSRVEALLLAATAGLGAFGLLLTLLGLAHLFFPPLVLGVPLACALVGLPAAWRLCRTRISNAPSTGVEDTTGERVLTWLTVSALAVLAAGVLVQDLAPPTDYDGLLYHLVAPRTFLAAHAIVYIPDNFSANLPALGEILYAWDLAAGSDRVPQLVHGIAGVLCVGLTFALGRRCLGGGRMAFAGAAGLAATPLIPFLSTRAYIDLFTLLFALVAFLGFAAWRTSRRLPWLVLGGAAAGLALDTKYAAISVALIVGAGIFASLWLGGALRTLRTLPAGLLPASTFGAAAFAAALPWYGRQALALGSPVWPMYFGGRDWDPIRVQQLTYFVNQYGAGHRLRDWLLLPVNVYGQSWRFGHVPDSYPPILALASPLAVAGAPVAGAWLLGAAAGLLLVWVRGWQDLRFLLPAYPLFALLGAAGLWRVARGRAYGGAVAMAVVSFLAIWAAGRELPAAADAAPAAFGVEPVDSYLVRKLPDQRAINVLNAQQRPGDAALFLGDGQIWYCRQRCIPDAAHDNLLQWFTRPGSPEASLALLRRASVSHVLLSKRDYWYLEHQDPENRLKKQLNDFYVFKARYLDMVYEDDLTELYRGRW